MPKMREFRTRSEMEKVSSIVVNTIFFTVGVLAFFSYHIVPPSIGNALIDPAVHSWALLLVVSCPMVIFGRVRSIHRLEALGKLGVGFAFLIYALSVFATSLPHGISPALFFLAISFSMIYKGYRLNRLAKEVTMQDGRASVS